MCSIEEAWAGQLFDNKHVQSQADLHRKYMDIPDGLLQHNNEFSMGYKLPTPRESTRGYESRVPQHLISNNKANINISSMTNERPQYGGQSPRPEYMSIYDNEDRNNNSMTIPMPNNISSLSTTLNKNSFNDINNAFNVSDTVNRFMNIGSEYGNNNINTNSSSNKNNMLLNEDNEDNRVILNKKFQNMDTMANINKNSMMNTNSLNDIINRLERLERDFNMFKTRNMYDMTLYILVGMLIAFIIYSLLRK